MRMLKINWGSIGTAGEVALGSLSRIPLYWPFSWRGLSAIILGVLLAKWFWILFAPHPIYTAAAPERAVAVEAGQLFGVALVTEASSQGVALPNVQLLGVFAASDSKPGFAVLKLDNSRQIGIAEGEEVAAGTRLIEVHADHVMLERTGVQQRVNLENKYAGSPNSSQLMSLPPAQGAAANRIQQNEASAKNTSNRMRPPRR